MATLSVIRRWALREQLSIREIARRTGLSRNTIRRYLRAGTVEPRYGKRISPSKLDPYADKLSGWLKSEATKSRKQRRTLKQTRRLATAEALYYDALNDTVDAIGRKAERQKQDASLTEANLNLQKSQLQAEIDLARLNGNEYQALQLTIQLKQTEIRISEAKIAATVAEAKATIAGAEATKTALEAEGKLTEQKKLEIEASIKSAQVRLLEAQAAGANIEVQRKQLENLKLYGTEMGNATAASGRLRASYDGVTSSGREQAAQSILQKIALGQYITETEATVLANTHLAGSFNSLADAARNARVQSTLGKNTYGPDKYATDAAGQTISIAGKQITLKEGQTFDKAAYDRDAAKANVVLSPERYVRDAPISTDVAKNLADIAAFRSQFPAGTGSAGVSGFGTAP